MSVRGSAIACASMWALIAAMGSTAASAQEGPSDQTDLSGVDIIVTAQKRDERVIDLPLAISVIGSDFAERRNIVSLEDAARFVPNTRLDFGQGSQSDNKVTIRGLTSTARNAQPGIDPNVAFYVDGVYLQRPEQLNPELIDLERVEVLRGPQGTLYGKNSTVGAINIITQTPSLVDSKAVFDAQYGNYDAVRLRGNVQVPLIRDVAAISLSGYFSDDDGLRRNSVDGAAVGDLRRYGFRGKFHAKPVDDLTVTLGADFQSDRTNSSIGDLLRIGFDPAFLFLPPPFPPIAPGNVFDRTVSKTPNAEENSVRSWGGFLNIGYDFSGATLTSLTGYRGFNSKNFIDLDFSAEPYFRSGRDNKQWQLSEELRLVSTGDGPIDWLIGVYLHKANLKSDLQTNVDDATLAGLPPIFGGTQQLAETDLDIDSQAIFGQLGFRPTERLTLRVGIRGDRERRDLLTSQTVGTLFGGVAGFLSFPPTRFRRTERDIALMGSLSYEVAGDVNVYATYSEGTKSGGFNGGGLSGSAASLDPARLEFGKESARNYELGLKALLADRKVSLALSAFRIDFRDLQVNIFDPPEIRTANAARARSSGVEFETAAELGRLSLLGSAAYNKARYRKYPNGPLPGGLFGDRSGTDLANAPRWQLAGTALYTAPLANGAELYGGFDALYTSAQNLDESGDPICRQKGYGLLNARVGVRFDGDRIDLQGWASNLTDTDYLVSCGLIGSVLGGGPGFNRLVGSYLGVPGRPRTYGLLVRYRF
jgi:Outer membrane receptor proteins, mostly Fe transport